MSTILLCFILLCHLFSWIFLMHLPIYFRVTSLALGQSYDCPSANEVTLKDTGKSLPTKYTVNCDSFQHHHHILKQRPLSLSPVINPQGNYVHILQGIQVYCSDYWRFHLLFHPGYLRLTQWGWDKMAAILQMTHLKTFSQMKMLQFCL